MSYVLIHADRASTLLADSPLVPANDVGRLKDALATLSAARDARDGQQAEAKAACAAGHAEGYAAGHAAGWKAGEAEWRAALCRLAADDSARMQTRRGEVAALAIEVVRHIAGEIGPDSMVAALARRAAAALAPDEMAVLRVPPAAADRVTEQLGHRSGLTIEPDAGLAADDCVLETALGRTHAGLETQLAQIERAWAQQPAGDPT